MTNVSKAIRKPKQIVAKTMVRVKDTKARLEQYATPTQAATPTPMATPTKPVTVLWLFFQPSR